MSAGFLQGIRLKAARLKEALVEAGKLDVRVWLTGEREVVLEAIEAEQVEVASVIQKIRDALSAIQRDVDRWLEYMKGLTGEVHAAEMKVYSAEATSAGSYLHAVDEGEAAYSQLKRNLEQLEAKYVTVCGPKEVPPSGSKVFTPGRVVKPKATRGRPASFGHSPGGGGRRIDFHSPYGEESEEKREGFESGSGTHHGGHGHSGTGRGGMSPRESVEDEHRPRVKLPKIRLPEFSGDITEFKSFWDTFAATIDTQSFSKVEKLAYLKGLLKGEAEQAVSGYPVTEESYDVIVEVLHERYGNEELIVHMLYNELDDMPRSGSGIKETRQAYEKLEKVIRMLEALGENVNQAHIGVVYTSCMPSWVVTKIHEKKGSSNDWSVSQLRQVVGDAIRFKELVAFMECDYRGIESRDTGFRQRQQQSDGFQKNSQSEGYRRQGSGATLSCVYCSGGHYSDVCQVVESAEDRKRILSAERRCFMCTRQGHKISNCSGMLCKCGGWHHRSICPGIATAEAQGQGAGYNSGIAWGESNNREQVRATVANAFWCADDKRSEDEDRSDDEELSEERRVVAALKVTTCVSGSYQREAVAGVAVPIYERTEKADGSFLMTAEAPVSDPDSNRITKAAIFFDPGSDVTLIKESLAQRLELKPLRESRMVLETVSGEGGSLVHGHGYVIEVHQKDGTARAVEAFSVKTLIGRVKRLRVVRQSGISEEEAEPEILVGVQDFWNFVKGARRFERGLTLVNSTVGPMLCGRRLDASADAVPSGAASLEEQFVDVCKAWEAEGIGVTNWSSSRTEAVNRGVTGKWSSDLGSHEFGTGGGTAAAGVANLELSGRRKKALWHPLESATPVPEAESISAINEPVTCSLPWSSGQWSPSLAGSVADCFDAVAITQTPCSAVVDDELFRRRKASTSADGTMLFDPQDAKEQ